MDPYNGKDPMAVAIEVLQKRLRPVISPQVPAELQELILDCWAQEPTKRPSFMQITDRLRSMTMQHPVYNFGSHSASRNEAPTGNLYLVATEIENLFALWDAHPRPLQNALSMLK
jgi:Protein tyrosine and serine/threonine kinase